MIGPKLLKDVGAKAAEAAGASSTHLSFDLTTGKHLAVTATKASPVKLTEFFAPTSTKGISIPKRARGLDTGGAAGAGAGGGGAGGGGAGGGGAGADGAGGAAAVSSPAKKARTED
jgi:hypothetical protein